MSAFIVKIGVGRNSSDTLVTLRTFDFSSFLGGERREVPYSVFSALKQFSSDPVEFFETVPVSFGGICFLALVDEEGAVRESPDPVNYALSVACGSHILGDVFIVKADAPEMLFLSSSDVRAIFSEFCLDPDVPFLVPAPADCE